MEDRTRISQAYSKGQGNPNQANYTMLFNGAIEFDFAELQAFNDDCMVVVLPRNFIALLESLLRFADGSPHLWRDVANRKDPKWFEIKQFVANGRACLLMGCKVDDLNTTLKEQVKATEAIVTLLKYLTAAVTDGKVRDFYYDPAKPEVFAENVGVDVADLPAYDFNPTDGDIFHPNLSTFDDIGNSILTDPVTGTTWSTSRRMVEEVPSTFIYDGWTDDVTMAEMYAQTMYFNVGTASIPFMEGLTNNLERIDLVLRHLDAKLSRSGRLDLNLPDVPQLRNPLTGERVELAKVLDAALANGGSWLGVPIPPVFAPGSPWPLLAYTKPSVFTAGGPRSDDPLGVNEELYNTDTHVGEILANGLLANWRPTIRLSEGLAPIFEFPALDIPLPSGLGNITIPAIPLYAGTYEGVIPGEPGRGLAYLLKQEEEPVIRSVDLPVIGTVLFRWQRDKLAIKLPKMPTVPGFSKATSKWIYFLFGQVALNGLVPNQWIVIWPKARAGAESVMRNYDIKLEGKGLGQMFKDIMQLQVPNPNYDKEDSSKGGKTLDGLTFAELFKDVLQIQLPNPAYKPLDPNDPTTVAASKLPQTLDGKTLAELFWIEAAKESGEFGKDLPGKSFAQLFNLEVDDPNYRSYIQSHAQILNFMQIKLAQNLEDLIKELEECCTKGVIDDIKKAMDKIATSAHDLTMVQQAMAKIGLLQYSGVTGDEVNLDLADPANVVNTTNKVTAPTPFSTGTLLETNSISDILHIALLDDGSPIPDFNPLNAESKLDGIRTDINASTVHFTGNFQQLMEWFAGSFRSGLWNGLNPFSHESFFDLTRRSLNKPGALALNDKPYLEQFNESFTAWATDFGLFKDIHQAMKDCICAANGLLETIGENILGISPGGGSTPITNNINVSPTPITVAAPNVTVTPTVTVSNPTDLTGLIDAVDCLVATQRAIVTVKGGVNPTGCDDIGSGGGGEPDGGGSETDCATIEMAVSEIINVLDWLVWGIETVGGTVGAPIVSALSKFRWFVAVLVAAGLVEPSPAEEIVTVPAGLVAILTLFVEEAIEIGAAALREMVNQMKVSQKQIAAVICGEGEIDLKLDEVVNSVVDALTDEATKEGIKIMLKKFLKAPDIKKVLL